jgi:enoyl-CoA hydratase
MTTTRLLQGEITDNLIIEKRGAVGWITFNDPAKHNAMSYEMWAALPGIIKMFENDDEIRAVVLTGAGGKSFVSGANISQLMAFASVAV